MSFWLGSVCSCTGLYPASVKPPIVSLGLGVCYLSVRADVDHYGQQVFTRQILKILGQRVGRKWGDFHGILCVLLFGSSLFVSSASWGCRSATRSESKTPQVGWRPIDSWTGRGDTQTDSFNIESTQWRIKWDTKGARSPGDGRFHVAVHSAVSGRIIAEAVEQKGEGHGVAYVTEDPRLYHLVVDSDGLDWTIKVEEAVSGQPENPRQQAR